MVRDPARVRRLLIGALLSGALVSAGCADSAPEDDREVGIYASVLEWIFDRPDVTVGTTPEGDGPPAFIEHLGSGEIAIDVQVDIIGSFDDEVDIRFIDARQEALDESLPGSPVRDEGILIGLGPVTDGDPTEVRAEARYGNRIDAYRFTLVLTGGEWILDGEPALVDAEGLVSEP